MYVCVYDCVNMNMNEYIYIEICIYIHILVELSVDLFCTVANETSNWG